MAREKTLLKSRVFVSFIYSFWKGLHLFSSCISPLPS